MNWQRIRDEIAKSLQEKTPENTGTAIGQIWSTHSLMLVHRPQFISCLSGVILDLYQKDATQADALMRQTKVCFRVVAVSTGWPKTEPRLPDLLEFALLRLQARLHPDDLDTVFPWLRRCYNLADEDAAHFFNLLNLDRDEEMRRLIFTDKQEKEVHRHFVKNPAGRLHLRKIANWFLRRYDLPRALQLFWDLDERCPGRWARGCVFCFPSLFVGLFFLTVFLMHSYPVVAEMAGTVLLLAIAFLGVLTWFLFSDVLLPRMLGGTAIGYLLLFPVKDLWEFSIVKAEWSQVLALAFLVGGASWAYLNVGEVRKVVKRGKGYAPTLLIFLIGLSQSASIGFIVSVLLTPTVAGWQPYWLPPPVTLRELVGIPFGIYPKALVFYVFLALFVGIVSQILWEDKPITEPL